MDIEEIVIETLRLVETFELEHHGPPHIYTCYASDSKISNGIFSDIAMTGELCVCASSKKSALLLFFLINGIFDHGNKKLEWYLNELQKHIDLEFDDITPEDAINIWTDAYKDKINLKEHDVTKPMIITPSKRAVITLTPGLCDIWTLPRVRRQFTD